MERELRQFAELVAGGEGALAGNLDQGALLIAAAIDSAVDVQAQLNRLDELAETIVAESPGGLAIALFGGAGHDPARHFGGNSANYYESDNSLLHRVLDRRTGIPITLAVLLIEVGRRHGLSMHGVGMPGHFLVGSADGYIDSFHGGQLIDRDGCERLYQRLAGDGVALPAGALRRTPDAMILKRMLLNLAAIGAHERDRRLRRAVWSLLAAFPEADHRDHVQHAYAAAEFGQFDEAAHAGERALQTAPDAVHGRLEEQIHRWQARLN